MFAIYGKEKIEVSFLGTKFGQKKLAPIYILFFPGKKLQNSNQDPMLILNIFVKYLKNFQIVEGSSLNCLIQCLIKDYCCSRQIWTVLAPKQDQVLFWPTPFLTQKRTEYAVFFGQFIFFIFDKKQIKNDLKLGSILQLSNFVLTGQLFKLKIKKLLFKNCRNSYSHNNVLTY